MSNKIGICNLYWPLACIFLKIGMNYYIERSIYIPYTAFLTLLLPITYINVLRQSLSGPKHVFICFRQERLKHEGRHFVHEAY